MAFSKNKYVPTSLADVKELHRRALDLNKFHESIVQQRKRDISLKQEEHKRQLAALPNDPGTLRAVMGTLEKDLQQHRAAVVKASEGDRLPPLKSLNELREAASDAKQFMSDHRSYLTAHFLGSADRANIHAELREYKDSPSLLRSLAARAAAEASNPETMHRAKLVSAILCNMVDQMNPESRPFSTRELAEACVGEEVASLNAMLTEIDLAFTTAWARDKELTTGKSDPHAKISEALARRAIEHPSSDDEEAEAA